MASETPALPRTWDLSSYFPDFDGPAYSAFVSVLSEDLAEAIKAGTTLPALSKANAPAWVDLFSRYESVIARISHLSSYLGCLGAADSANEEYQAHTARLALISAEVSKLKAQLLRGWRHASDEAFDALIALPAAGDAAHALRSQRLEAIYQMSVAEESLASDLGVDGASAWGRLYDTLNGKMSFEMEFPDGQRRTVPMAQRRALMENSDPIVRRRAFESGNKVWEASAGTCAAAINSLAGSRHTLYGRRGRDHFLDAPLHDAGLSRQSLDAMFAAIEERYEVPRKLLRIKARLQGTRALAWCDLEVPLSLDPVPDVSWDESVALVQRAFDSSYPRLGEYFRSTLAKRWIESEKRPNKRSGAFCTGSPLTREERVYMTFNGSVGDVVTLAHEMGHAWHSHVLGDLRPIARDYPMTLAETASTFAEKILVHGLLSEPGITPARRTFLLGMETGHIPAYLLNIPARFFFESRFYEERKAGVVPVTRLCELMAQTQREVYGDTLEGGLEDPWFWASKLHFFMSDISFYNFPYTFGYLLSEALFSQFKKEGPAFLPRYEAFLRATGRATCEEAVQSTLGWDLRDRAFWVSAIESCGTSINAFDRTVTQAGR